MHTQDTHVIQVPFMDKNSSGFFAVYDGHGGKEAADLVSTELHKFLELELGNTEGSVHESFIKVRLYMLSMYVVYMCYVCMYVCMYVWQT